MTFEGSGYLSAQNQEFPQEARKLIVPPGLISRLGNHGMHETVGKVSRKVYRLGKLAEGRARSGTGSKSGNVATRRAGARSSVYSDGRRGSRFHEWDDTAVKSRRWVNLYQLTPIIASARAKIRGQNEPTLACQPISPSQRAPCTPPHTTHPRSQLDTTLDATLLSSSLFPCPFQFSSSLAQWHICFSPPFLPF